MSFSLLPGGKIAVPLGESGRIKVFARTDSIWALEETLDFQTPALAICSMPGGRLFSSGYRDEANTIINELANPPRSFGAGYQYDDSFIRPAMSEGFLDCFGGANRVVFAFDILPVVRSYSAANDMLFWTARVEGYIQLQVEESIHSETGTTSRSRLDRVNYDRMGTVAGTASGDHILLQYGRVFPEKRQIVAQTFLLDAATGVGAFLGDSLPPVLSVQANSYIAIFADPYPRLEVRTFGGAGPAG